MTDRELMDRAWDYLAAYTVGERPNASDVNDLIFALENRLAQPEQKENWQYVQQLNAFSYPRPWVGLTEEEIKECFKVTPDLFLPWHIYSRIEAKLKDKNT